MNSFNKYTVFRTVRSIYEHSDNIVPCVVTFTPCNDMALDFADWELHDVFDIFDYLLKNQFDHFAESAIYKGNSSPLNISELVSNVIDIMNANYLSCNCSIIKPVEDVYLEELTGIRSSAPALIRDINEKKENKKVNIQYVEGMVTDADREKAKKLEEEYNSKK